MNGNLLPNHQMLSKWKSGFAALMRSREIATVAVVLATIRMCLIVFKYHPRKISLDFSLFYTWAWALRHHINPYLGDLTPYARQLHVNIGVIVRSDYPPTFLLMFEPLTWFSPPVAFWIWTAISVALLLLSLTLLIPREKAISIPTALIVISLGVIYRPVQTHFVFLQTQILVLFLLVLMWRALKRGDDFWAGTWLAITGLLKVFPLFMMLYLVCMRKWRVMAYTGIVMAVGFVLTLVIMGPVSFGFFTTVVRHVTPVVGIPESPIIGIDGTVVRLTQHFDPNDSNHALLVIRNVVEVLLELGVLGITAMAIMRSRRNQTKAEYAFGLCVAAMVLCYPNSWTHYMVLFLFPMTQIAIAAETGDAPLRAAVLAVIAYVLAEISYDSAHKNYIHHNMSVGLWLIEGMSISTVLTFAAAYSLTVSRERPIEQRRAA